MDGYSKRDVPCASLLLSSLEDVATGSLLEVLLAVQGDMRIQQDKLTAFMSPAAADAVEAELQSTLGSHFAGQDESESPSVLLS